jgi:hypothetical protein
MRSIIVSDPRPTGADKVLTIDSPQIFQNLGLKGTNTSLFATGIYGVVKVMSSLIFALFLAGKCM